MMLIFENFGLTDSHLLLVDRFNNDAQAVWGSGCVESSEYRYVFISLVIAWSSIQLIKEVGRCAAGIKTGDAVNKQQKVDKFVPNKRLMLRGDC